MTTPSLETLRALPKVELHCHLDGAVRPATLLDVAREAKIELPPGAPVTSVEALLPFVQVPPSCRSLREFLQTFENFYPVLSVPGLMRRVAREVLEDAAADGIVHRELRFCPALQASDAQSMEAVLDDVLAGLTEGGEASGVSWGLIVCLYRPIEMAANHEMVELAVARRAQGVVGLDLAGPEDLPGHPFAEAIARGQQSGLAVTVHAGEAAGPESVREAIDVLGAQRLGHGVALRHDEALAEVVRERGITIECCPTSNLQTAAVESLDEHPFDALRRRGHRVTLNTDDPAVCGVTLSEEYALAARQWNLDLDALRGLARAAAEAAFLDDARRAALLQRLD